jgi:hypothetical protein
MIDTIKEMDDLPAWFKLEKYKEAKNLDEIGWYRQLVIRHLLNMQIPYQADKITGENKFAKAAELVRECPIIAEKNEIFLSRIVDEATREISQKKPSYTLGVHQMTYYDLFQLLMKKKSTTSKNVSIQDSYLETILIGFMMELTRA